MTQYIERKKENADRSPQAKNEDNYRGTVIIPYLQGLSEQLKRIASKHRFRAILGNKIKEMKAKAQKPLTEKQKAVVYKGPASVMKLFI